MRRYGHHESTCFYDSMADVMYITFKDVPDVIGQETPRGYFVMYRRQEVTGVTILDFAAHFPRGEHTEIEIDAESPFIVELDSDECLQAEMA